MGEPLAILQGLLRPDSIIFHLFLIFSRVLFLLCLPYVQFRDVLSYRKIIDPTYSFSKIILPIISVFRYWLRITADRDKLVKYPWRIRQAHESEFIYTR